MSVPTALEYRNESHDDEWQSNERQKNMRRQKWEINDRDPSGVAGRFFTDLRVIDNVADQKTGRGNEGDDHAGHMALPDVAPDPKPTQADEDGADQIEHCIDRG